MEERKVRQMTNNSGFGLAQIKQEGMCSSFDHPEISPWVGYRNEFNKWFKDENIPWYLIPFKTALMKIALSSWDYALMTNAKNRER